MKKFGITMLIEKGLDVVLTPFKAIFLWINGIKWLAWVLVPVAIAMIWLPPETWGFFENLLGFFGILFAVIAVAVLLLYRVTGASKHVKKIEDTIEHVADAGANIADDLSSKAGSAAVQGIKDISASLKKS